MFSCDADLQRPLSITFSFNYFEFENASLNVIICLLIAPLLTIIVIPPLPTLMHTSSFETLETWSAKCLPKTLVSPVQI